MKRPSEYLGLPGLQIDLNQTATKRYAVVIGNGAYERVGSLPNAVADARLVAGVMRQAGYIVESYENLDRRGFEAAFRRMIADTDRGSEVVIYYAGHGVQIGDSNRLIPVDAKFESIYDLPFETVSLSSVLSIMGARSRSLTVILDSCRDNPFRNSSAIVGLDATPATFITGFAAQDSPVNSLIVFSTSPGARALDGTGKNSPFTQSLYEAVMATPDAPFSDILKDVRRKVFVATGGLQVPWESSSLIETLYLDGEPSVAGLENGTVETGGSASAETGADLPEVALALPLDRKVRVGEALMETAAKAPSSLIVSRGPERGRLEMASGNVERGLTLMVSLGAGTGDLLYKPSRAEVSALALPGTTITDGFDVISDGARQRVNMSLTIDPCDFQAGDHLDPEGVGVARYPNEIEVDKAMAACATAVARDPASGRFHYQMGRAQLAARDLEGAAASFKTARDLGHTRAWQSLGLLEMRRQRESGEAVGQLASGEALALLAMGVERGDPYAYHTLGAQLLNFSDNLELQRQGFDLLSRSMEVGHTFSMNALGLYFLQEDSTHYEPERGLRYLRESAARGDIYGFDNLGHVALAGAAGTKRDPEVAFDWFSKASDQGHPTAPTSIGRMFASGDLGPKPDIVTAIGWYDIGLARGDAWGGANAAWLILNKGPAEYGVGDGAARAAKAAALHNPEAVAAAQAVLDVLPPSVLDAGSQVILVELGEALQVDGVFGSDSVAAVDRIAARFGTQVPPDAMGRLKRLAALFWTTQAFRVDLY